MAAFWRRRKRPAPKPVEPSPASSPSPPRKKRLVPLETKLLAMRALEGEHATHEDAQRRGQEGEVGGQRVAQLPRESEHPLAVGCGGQDAVDEVGGGVGGAKTSLPYRQVVRRAHQHDVAVDHFGRPVRHCLAARVARTATAPPGAGASPGRGLLPRPTWQPVPKHQALAPRVHGRHGPCCCWR